MTRGALTSERGSRVADVAIALALGGYAGLDALNGGWPEPRLTSALLAAMAGAFLAVRRLRPLTALAGAVASLAAISVFLGHFETGSSVLIALLATYSAAAYGRNLPFLLAVVLGFSATEGLRQPVSEGLPDILWTVVALALPIGMGLSVRQSARRAQSSDQNAERAAQEQHAAVEAATQGERLRIARELHDVISHGLGVVMLQAGAAESVLERDPGKARESLRLIRVTGQEAIAELGTLLSLMRDESSGGREPQPTLADVEGLVQATRSAGLAVTLRRDGVVRILAATVELNAYRVVQEGLTNAVKHAGEANVYVHLHYADDYIAVEVSDDGDANRQPGPGNRRGLIWLRERVTVFGGEFQAGRDQCTGWTLRATFPTTP